MDCVKLYYKESLIGVLTYDVREKQYIFVKNKFFDNDYIESAIGIKDKEIYYSNHLFPFFFTFLKHCKNPNPSYQDLVEIAKLKLDRNQFWIGV